MATLEDVFEQLQNDIQKSINESVSYVEFVCNCSPTSNTPFLFTSKLTMILKKNIDLGVNQIIINNNNIIFSKISNKSQPIEYNLSNSQDDEPPFKITEGIPSPPKFEYDNGFLDKFKMREPTYKEKLKYDYWRMKAAAARVLRDDLDDALDAYEHFLDNTGSPFEFDLGEYIKEDLSGEFLLNNAKDLTKDSIRKLIKKSGVYTVSSSGFRASDNSLEFSAPTTENWQKTIGEFNFWISASVVVIEEKGLLTYNVAMTIHAEDKYNFNPGQTDIATGIPDSENGIFEITGLAKQFMQYGTHTVKIQWSESASKN